MVRAPPRARTTNPSQRELILNSVYDTASLSSNASINKSPITVYISFPIIIRETFKFNLNTKRRNPSFSVLQSATGSLVEKTRFDTTKVDKEIRQNRFVTLG